MMAPKAIIAGAARIRAGRRAGAPTARHSADLLGLTPCPVLDRPGAGLARVDGVIARRVLRHEQLSPVPPGTRCCRPPLGPPARGLLTGLPCELGRPSGRSACSPSPADHLRGSETANTAIIERL